MYNGSTVTFNSKNLDTYNGRKEYLVFQHKESGTSTLGTVFYNGSEWVMGSYRYKNFSEIKAVVRHVYTGSTLEDQ